MTREIAVRSESRPPAAKKKLLGMTIIAMVVIQVISVRSHWPDVQAKRVDFATFYASGKLAREGDLDYREKERRWVQIESNSSATTNNLITADKLHPPFELLIFAPISLLPYTTAYLLWFGCNLVLLWSVPIVLWEFIPGLRADFHFIAIALGSILPVSACLVFGQDAILLLFLLALAYVSLERGKEWKTGMFLGLGMFKFQLIIPIVAIFVLLRSWKVVIGFIGAVALMLCSSVALIGAGQTVDYFLYVLAMGKRVSTTTVERTPSMPNLRGLISLGFGGLLSPSLQTALIVAISIVIFLLVLKWTLAHRFESPSVVFALLVTMSSLLSYYYYVYNSVIIVLPLLLFANELETSGKSPRRNYTFALTAILTYVIPLLFPLEIGMPAQAGCTLVLLALLLTHSRTVVRTEIGDSHSFATS